MTNRAQPKLNQAPAILVFGTPTSPELTQAAWFRAEDKAAVKAAAAALKFSTIELHTDARKSLAVRVPEGVLKSSGRMIVGSVPSEVCRRIEEYHLKALAEGEPKNVTSAEKEAKSMGRRDNAAARETLRAGARVLAAYWNEKREFEGFWLATVKRIEPSEFTLEWFDAPEYPAFKSRPLDIAVRIPSSASRASDARKSVLANSLGRPLVAPFDSERCPNQTRSTHPQPQKTKS